MLKKLAKLLDVKSLVTLSLTGVFAYLSVAGIINGEQFLTIYTTIIAFFFGVKAGKREAEEESEVESNGNTKTS